MSFSCFIVALMLLSSLCNASNALTKQDEKNAVKFLAGANKLPTIYTSLIDAFKNGETVTRNSMMNAYGRDPFLKRTKQGSGHAKYVCSPMGYTFCVIAHGSGEIESEKERRGHHSNIAQYTNVVRKFLEENQNNLPLALKQMTANDWTILRGQAAN